MKSRKTRNTVTVKSKWYDLKTTIVTANDQLLVPLRVEDIADARTEAIADCYRLFRIDKLVVSFYTRTGATLGYVGFSPGITAKPTTAEPILSMHKCAVWYPIQVRPSQLVLTRNDLVGPLPWYYTVGQSTEQFEVPGSLFLATASETTKLAVADSLACVFEATFTFKDPLSSGMTSHTSLRKCNRLSTTLESSDMKSDGIVTTSFTRQPTGSNTSGCTDDDLAKEYIPISLQPPRPASKCGKRV
jgi:hypothetical protein